MKKILVKKYSGEKEPYNPEKVRAGLKRSGASDETVDDILKQLEEKLYNGITTHEIFELAFSFLSKKSPKTAQKYNLKRSLYRLGCDGHNFEKFMWSLFRYYGYSAKLNKIIEGKCVGHEVDIDLEKDGKRIMTECKYHHQPGYRCRMPTALYVYARYLDIKDAHPDVSNLLLATSSKFSSDVIKYAECTGFRLLGWDYPERNLQDMIEEKGLYPVTIFELTPGERDKLLKNKYIFARHLLEKDERKIQRSTGIRLGRIKTLREMTKELVIP